MIADSVKFKNHPCFKKHWSGLDEVKPITLIIGKNNTGKSHLLKFVQSLCTNAFLKGKWDLQVTGVLDEESLKSEFRPGSRGGPLGSDHWRNCGMSLVGRMATWTKEAGQSEKVEFEGKDAIEGSENQDISKTRIVGLTKVFNSVEHPFKGKVFKYLYADRDIQPEASSNDLTLAPNGNGATNIVRKFIHSADPRFPRSVIQSRMLSALNEVFGEDGNFREITVQHHDGNDPKAVDDLWEIFLEQEHKGLIPLSSSGSGLKTIFLVLLHLLVVPEIEAKNIKDYVFAFEEIENNLHPSLIRNLLFYIRSTVDSTAENPISKSLQVFLTTHSNVALDFFADDELSQIIHVTHDGESAKTHSVSQSSKILDVIWDLGTRPSDLLQANGIIWVEGPSDRIYLNRWIELCSGGRYREGRHYQCAFYGGGLLSNLQVAHQEDADKELINLLKINPNVVVVSDSDRNKKGAHLKPRVRRIHTEFDRLDKTRSFHWILEAREIENYLTADFINLAIGGGGRVGESPSQYESFFPKDNEGGYLLNKMNRKTCDKAKLAALIAPHMTVEQLKERFDWESGMDKITSLIEVWNR